MKALQQISHVDIQGRPADAFRLIDVPDPDPGPDDIVMEMLAVPVHGLEVRDATDPTRIPASKLPKTPGLEGCGRITFVGANVTEFVVGDLALPPPRCGTYQQFLCARADACFPAPRDASPEQLALVLINGMTSALLFDLHTTLAPGRWLIQNGANSSCGRWLIALAKAAGLFSVNVVRRDSVFDSLYDAGADACLVDTGTDSDDAFAARVAGVTQGAGLHLGFDTVGGVSTGRMAHCLSADSKLIVYGNLSGEPSIVDQLHMRRKEMQITGYRKSVHEPGLSKTAQRAIYTRLCGLISDGYMTADIAGTYSFKDYAAAFAHAMKDGPERTGKVLLLPNT